MCHHAAVWNACGFWCMIEVYFLELERKGRVLILYRVQNIQSRGRNVLLDIEHFLWVFLFAPCINDN